MSLIEVERLERDPRPATDELLVGGDKRQAVECNIKPSEILVQVLQRPDELVNEITQDSIHTWLDQGMRFQRLTDKFGGWINMTRNWQSRLLLKTPNLNWLLLIDADVGVPWNAPYLLARHRQPVVSGVVPCWNVDRGGLFLNVAVKDPNGTARFPTLVHTKTIPKRGLVECHNTGCGCLLIRRDVIERLWELYEQDNDFGQPFELTVAEMRTAGYAGAPPRGEDICFTDRARKAGFKVFADFEVMCDHRKEIPLHWPDDNVQEIDIKDWVTSVFDYKVKQE